jgi:hypothetical protein
MSDHDPRICEACGEKRVRVGGLVCPNGHGKIHPLAMLPIRRRGRPKICLPLARLVGNGCKEKTNAAIFTIVNQGGHFRKRHWSFWHNKWNSPEMPTRARMENDRTAVFVPCGPPIRKV